MKRNVLSALLLAGLGLSAHAGVEMKTSPKVDPKQMAPVFVDPPSDAGFYVGVYGGAQFSTNYGDNRQTLDNGIFGISASVTTKIHSDWGAVGGIKAGYHFDSFGETDFLKLRLQPAVEVEGLYIGNNSHVHDLSGFGSSEKFSSNSGDFFVNGILRFKNCSIVTPYIGVGVGCQYFTTHGSGTFAPVPGGDASGINTSDLDFAAQALFGIDVTICHHVTIFTEYKFIDALGNDGDSSGVPLLLGGGTYRLKPDQIQQNLITAGVKYEF